MLALLPMLVACASSGPSATSTASPSETATPAPSTKTPFPTFTPTAVLNSGTSIVVGGDLRVRSEPNTGSAVVKTLKDQSPVQITAFVDGENVLVGKQTWL